MTTLTVSATTDFSADLLENTDFIEFGVPATATFSALQFDNLAILDTVLIYGLGSNHIIVNGGSLDASQWQFQFWNATFNSITLNGTSQADTITGSYANDTLIGRNGDDTLTGGGGDDTIKGGAGRDTIAGGTGTDRLFGGTENDRFLFFNDAATTVGSTINGGAGLHDKIVLEGLFSLVDFSAATIRNVEILEFRSADAASFSGEVFGPAGISKVIGPSGAPTSALIITGSSVDLSAVTFVQWENNGVFQTDRISIDGTLFADTLTGSAYEDFIDASFGADIIAGGDGNDTILPDIGEDTVDGGGGNDRIMYDAGEQIEDGESIEGGAGDSDAIVLAGASATDRHFDFTGVVVNGIEALEVSGPGSISDPVTVTLSPLNFTISAIQHVTLSVETIFVFETGVVELFNVVFDGTAAALSSTLITGIAGNDVLAGGSLSDVITGGSAVDVMTGAGGNDIFRFTSGADIVAGEYIDGGDDIDTLELTAALAGSADFTAAIISSIEGLAMLGAGQKAILTAELASALTEVTGSAGKQTLQATGSAIDLSALAFAAWGGSDAVKLTGTAGDDTITGSSQDDIILGLDGDDTFDAGTGDDDITGGLGRDLLTGGEGVDRFIYQSLDDTPTGDTRDRIIDFTQGEDAIVIDISGLAFTFIEDNGFSGLGSAEISYQIVGAITTLNFDGDGDGTAEAKIAIVGAMTITNADLVFL